MLTALNRGREALKHFDSPVIVCATCHERLWGLRLGLRGNLVFVPMTTEVPFYSPIESKLCPFCEQSFHQGRGLLVYDEHEGHYGYLSAEAIDQAA